ncbi:MAG: hypothetical protein S0880_17475 [Actinomycetota bacterium]|nr:hypothetical protein [Actinomycetota bacterium]
MRRARDLEADWCEERARREVPFVSRSLYQGSARFLAAGHRRWSEVDGGVLSLPERGDTAP